MKPLAKLTVNRQRLYRKSCNDDDAVIPFSEGAETDFYDEKTEPTSTDQGKKESLHFHAWETLIEYAWA